MRGGRKGNRKLINDTNPSNAAEKLMPILMEAFESRSIRELSRAIFSLRNCSAADLVDLARRVDDVAIALPSIWANEQGFDADLVWVGPESASDSVQATAKVHDIELMKLPEAATAEMTALWGLALALREESAQRRKR